MQLTFQKAYSCPSCLFELILFKVTLIVIVSTVLFVVKMQIQLDHKAPGIYSI